MKTPYFFLIVFSVLTVAGQALAAGQSISDLPTLSAKLIHHFDCTSSVVTSAGSKEATFKFAPVGGQQPQGATTIDFDNESLEASGNAQMLRLDWKRSGKLIATGMMMIQKSPTGAFVLLLGDPSDESNQASVNCLAVTYDDRRGDETGGRP